MQLFFRLTVAVAEPL